MIHGQYILNKLINGRKKKVGAEGGRNEGQLVPGSSPLNYSKRSKLGLGIQIESFPGPVPWEGMARSLPSEVKRLAGDPSVI